MNKDGRSKNKNGKKIRYQSHILAELVKLKKLEKFVENVSQRLQKLYASIYPKKCHQCGATYYSREEYMKATLQCQSHPASTEDESSLNIEEKGKILEFRNCPCGATLVVIMTCRRDQSLFGERRRVLFQRCVRKIMLKENFSRDEAQTLVRYIFRHCHRQSDLQIEFDELMDLEGHDNVANSENEMIPLKKAS